MVHILLLFIRAQRQEIWNVKLYAFYKMEFENQNNCVVKGLFRRFDQVGPHQGNEWLSRVLKEKPRHS